jgi:16S rRNA (guanine527-N7)-methyltransferase
MFDCKGFENKLTYYFEKYKISFDDKNIKKFYEFANYLMGENKKYNLTAIKDLDGIIVKHFTDSAVVLNHLDLPENSRILDIGSGAGFPSVPLAVLREDLYITSLDSSAKKINFIKSAASLLSLKNLDFFCGRVEELDARGYYDFAVSRAVARLNILCEFAAPCLKTGGIFCAYKSKSADEELDECSNVFKILGLERADNIKFELESEERAFVIIKKIRETPEKYPRSFSQISKNPL